MSMCNEIGPTLELVLPQDVYYPKDHENAWGEF